MSAISNEYFDNLVPLYPRETLPSHRSGENFVAVTKGSPGVMPSDEVPFRDELVRQSKQEAEDRARIQAQRLSSEAGVQTDGTLYWLNAKNNKPLIEVEDFKGQDMTDSTGKTGKEVSSFGSGMSENEIATTTEGGTRVSVQSLPTNQAIGVPGAVVNLLNIETKNGLQIQMNLDQNVRITDLEDGGVSLYFPDTGETKTFGADGNVTTDKGEKSDTLEGTTGNDILINIDKSTVDAGEGNDTVFNFSNNAVINGGGGDDKIFLPGQTENVIVNTGGGNNTVYGGQVRNALINAQGSNDKLNASRVYNTNIQASGNLTVEMRDFRDGNLKSAGDMSATIGLASGTRIQVGGKNEGQADSPNNSYAKLQAKANIFISGFNDSFLKTGDGDDNIIITGADNSVINTGGGNDTLSIRHSYNSVIDMGDGDDKLIALGISGSKVSMGKGNDTVLVNSAGGQSTIDTGEGNDKLYFGNMDGVKLGIDATQDKIFDSYSGFLYPYFEDPTQENWNAMVDIAHRYEKTQLFKNYQGQSISMILGSGIRDGNVSFNV